MYFSDEAFSHQDNSSGLQGNYSVDVLEEERKNESYPSWLIILKLR